MTTLKISEAATLCDVSQTTIRAWMDGRPQSKQTKYMLDRELAGHEVVPDRARKPAIIVANVVHTVEEFPHAIRCNGQVVVRCTSYKLANAVKEVLSRDGAAAYEAE